MTSIRRSLLSTLCLSLVCLVTPPRMEARAGDAAGASATGSVAGAVTIFKGSSDGRARDDRSGVVVYLDFEPDPELATGDAPPPVREIHQIDKSFRPAVSAVEVGTEVRFPNDDKIFHNVFSLSKAKRFDLGLYKSGSSKSVVLTRPGVIDVYCNIHPEMWAKVVVLPHRFFAVTDRDGRFEIRDVPPGTYPVAAWHARGEAARGEVTVDPGGVATLELSVVETPQSTVHTRKDGTPYGRYQ